MKIEEEKVQTRRNYKKKMPMNYKTVDQTLRKTENSKGREKAKQNNRIEERKKYYWNYSIAVFSNRSLRSKES